MVNFLSDLFNLHNGEDDKQRTMDSVRSSISFTGSNLWILVCAVIVASVGLNVNSTAVVIGAMLISPLMGPIVASGFALATFDFVLLKKALRNLLIATITSLLVSTIYFYLSPFKQVQSEILARTSPNIYDILIAFFGGLVGVIAVTRVEKGNPIPGVAIATALMPPLCTAGYGLATGNFRFFLGAFFLYSINCVFICIATYVIVKFLKYPPKKDVDIKHQRQVRYGVSAIVMVMLIPSLILALLLFKQQQFNEAINNFIENEFVKNGNTVVYKKTYYSSSPKKVELAFLSTQFSKKEIDSLQSKLIDYGLTNTVLLVRPNNNFQDIKNDILNEISRSENDLNAKNKHIRDLENKLNSSTFDNIQLFKEAKTLFPSLISISLSRHQIYSPSDSLTDVTLLLYQAEKELNHVDKIKLNRWVEERNNLSNLKTIYYK